MSRRPDHAFRARMQELADRLQPKQYARSTAPDIQESIREEMKTKKKPVRSDRSTTTTKNGVTRR